MTQVTLFLRVQYIESCPTIPIWVSVECPLQQFHLNMAIKFLLKVIAKPFFNGMMKLLTCFEIYLVGFPLACLFSELDVVTWENKLHELIVFECATCIKIIELHQQLTILDCKLSYIALSQEIVKVNGVNVAIIVLI